MELLVGLIVELGGSEQANSRNYRSGIVEAVWVDVAVDCEFLGQVNEVPILFAQLFLLLAAFKLDVKHC